MSQTSTVAKNLLIPALVILVLALMVLPLPPVLLDLLLSIDIALSVVLLLTAAAFVSFKTP